MSDKALQRGKNTCTDNKLADSCYTLTEWRTVSTSIFNVADCPCTRPWTRRRLSLVHGSNFGQMPFLPPPIIHTATSGRWTQARKVQVRHRSHWVTATPFNPSTQTLQSQLNEQSISKASDSLETVFITTTLHNYSRTTGTTGQMDDCRNSSLSQANRLLFSNCIGSQSLQNIQQYHLHLFQFWHTLLSTVV